MAGEEWPPLCKEPRLSRLKGNWARLSTGRRGWGIVLQPQSWGPTLSMARLSSQMKSSIVTCLTASMFRMDSGIRTPWVGPPLFWHPGCWKPLVQHLSFSVLGLHYTSGLSFWSTGCVRQGKCLIFLLDPVVWCLVHIWHSTNIDGSELKQHKWTFGTQPFYMQDCCLHLHLWRRKRGHMLGVGVGRASISRK